MQAGNLRGAIGCAQQKVGHDYEKCETSRPPSPERLSSVLEALRIARNTTREQGDRIRVAMDFVLGPEPTAPTTQGVNPAPQGVAYEIGDVFHQLGEALNEVNHQLLRLERVVG